MKVQFCETKEFLEELEEDRDLIDRGILRVTVRRKFAPPTVWWSVVSTVLLENGLVYRLDCLLGSCPALDEEANRKYGAHADRIIDELRGEARRLRLEVRSGVIE